MTLVKKTSDNWNPSENPNMKIGEILDVTNPDALIKGGLAVLVDKQGNELEMPGQVFVCPICFEKEDGLTAFVEHVSGHLQKASKKLNQSKDSSVVKDEKRAAEIKAKRIAALKKARAVRKANLDKKKGKK